jgi:protein SCO1
MNPKKIVKTLFTAAAVLFCSGSIRSQAQVNTQGSNPLAVKNVWIDQKLGSQVPLDVKFHDEKNSEVTFKSLLNGKPAILVMPFYRCAGQCTLELDGALKALNAIRFNAGNEFNIIVVSIDPRENYTLGAAKKRDYLEQYQRPGAENGWHFLVGSNDSIQTLAASVGFKYTQDPKTGQIAHPVGLMFLTPSGKVSHYLFGLDYSPRDVKLSIIDASDSKIGSLSEYAALWCTHADATGKYTVAVTRILRLAAIGTILILAAYITAMIRIERKRSNAQDKGLPVKGTNSPGTA